LDADTDNSKCLALADAEVAEIQVKKGAKITKEIVRNLKLPYGMTLGALTRDGKCSLINGNTQIEAGDYVVVFCLSGSIHKIEKWFS
jgi:trk system potassium uptake protein TrkA